MSVRPDEIPALTGLRFIAAISVVLSHGLNAMAVHAGADPFWRPWLIYASAFGMSAFFVLSGFVIHYNYSKTIQDDHWRGGFNFFAARFARLYPMYFVCVTWSLYDHGYFFNLIYGSRPEDEVLRQNFWLMTPYYLTLTQSWKFSIVQSNALIYAYPFSTVAAVSWSVSTEFFFYLAYPVICLATIQLRRLRQTMGCTVLLAILALGLMALAHHYSAAIDRFGVAQFGPIAGEANGFQDSFLRWVIYFAPYARLPEFILGCLTAVLYRQAAARAVSKAEARFGTAAAGLAVMVVGAMMWVMSRPSNPWPFLQFLHMNFGFALPVAVLIFCAARYRNAISALLADPAMVRCGDASYSIYLLHIPIISSMGLDMLAVGQRYDWTSVILLRFALAVLVTISVSLVTYRLIEVPARRALRRLLMIPTPLRIRELPAES
ncbi:MAG TPA: acyltransferase [Stellaceae bacterium]|nr:acyltransferase [Stellaceae bacterium]